MAPTRSSAKATSSTATAQRIGIDPFFNTRFDQLAALAARYATPAIYTRREFDSAAASRQNWLYASHDYEGTRFADLRQITPANAAKLRAVCLYRFEQAAPTQTNPIVYDGVMYSLVPPCAGLFVAAVLLRPNAIGRMRAVSDDRPYREVRRETC